MATSLGLRSIRRARACILRLSARAKKRAPGGRMAHAVVNRPEAGPRALKADLQDETYRVRAGLAPDVALITTNSLDADSVK